MFQIQAFIDMQIKNGIYVSVVTTFSRYLIVYFKSGTH